MEKEMRTTVRWSFYNSGWDLKSVIGQCKDQGIPAGKVAVAIAKCYGIVKGFGPDRIGGALVIIFNLSNVPKEHI